MSHIIILKQGHANFLSLTILIQRIKWYYEVYTAATSDPIKTSKPVYMNSLASYFLITEHAERQFDAH